MSYDEMVKDINEMSREEMIAEIHATARRMFDDDSWNKTQKEIDDNFAKFDEMLANM